MNHSTPIEEEELVLTFAHRMRMELFQSRLQRPAWKRRNTYEVAIDIQKSLDALKFELRQLEIEKGEERDRSLKHIQEVCVKIGMYAAMMHDTVATCSNK